LLLSACGSRARDDIRGGESHFLKACESTCGGGLSCIDKQCTRECASHTDCIGLAKNAVCVGADDETTCNVASAAPCEEGGLNHAIGDEWPCSDDCNTCYCTEDGVVSTAAACLPTCEYEGKEYVLGDEWACSDGCNTCYCREDGVETTLVACLPTCEYDGNEYVLGDEWTCSDGCNTCTCLDDGTLVTTDRACPTNTCSSGGQEYSIGDVVELGEGATCVCQENGLLGQCTGAIIDGGLRSEPSSAVTTTPPDGGATSSDGRERCYLPPQPGECDGSFPSVYFDATNGQCVEFIYGGCGGNANRFEALDECYSACGGDAN
jgi:hypothetical protein